MLTLNRIREHTAKKISEVETKIGGLQASPEEHKERIEQLKADRTELYNQITAIKNFSAKK
jgi:uncharacterized coiled-coil DUF342 family protein